MPRSRFTSFRPSITLLEARDVPATFTVTTLADTGAGSLRAAIAQANAAADADIIVFDPSLAGQQLNQTFAADPAVVIGRTAFHITTPVVINGTGQTLSAPNLRHFLVTSTGDLTLRSLTLTDGDALGLGGAAGLGGAIYNQGTLRIYDSTLTGNSASGSQGSDFGGGGGLGDQAPPGKDGGPPNGGAGGTDGGMGGDGTDAANGEFGGGGGGGGNAGQTDGNGGNGGDGGFGGAGGTGGNVGNGMGNGGNAGNGGFGGAGGGGGISHTIGSDGSSGQGGFGGGDGGTFSIIGASGGSAGMGGAIFNQGGVVVIANSTITGNIAFGGISGMPGGEVAAEGGSAFGGGIFNLNGLVTLINATVAGNTLYDGKGGTNGEAAGGAVYNLSYNAREFVGGPPVTATTTATLTVANSILSGTLDGYGEGRTFSDVVNRQVDGTATINATGPNLVTVAVVNAGGSLTGTTFTVADAKLGQLEDNGGLTKTLALQAGSPAIDAGSAAAAAGLTADQRGDGRSVRVFGAGPDLGAFEVQPPVAVSAAPIPAAFVDEPYTTRVVIGGLNPPITAAVTAGALPPGITLAADGTLSGTPTAIGTFTFTVTATDAANPANTANRPLTLTVGLNPTADTDGDGLLDVWEVFGIDGNGDGVADYFLPGADRRHKDLFVEVDGMRGATDKLTTLALDDVVVAFANAPVGNPDRRNGINLVLIRDEFLLPFASWKGQDNPFVAGGSFTTFRTQYFGTPAERANPALLAAKSKAVRYAVFAEAYGSTSSSGVALGPNFAVTLGAFSRTRNEQAGTFMHEFGHTLGLDHAGDKGNPNDRQDYMSVMSYAFQLGYSKDAKYPASPLANFPTYSATSVPAYDDWANLKYAAQGAGSGALTLSEQVDVAALFPEHATPRVVVAPGPGQASVVQVLNATTRAELRSVPVFGGTFTGGVRVARGDFTGDGIEDFVAGAGPGGSPRVELYDGATGQLIDSLSAFEDSFTGGVFVAAADFNGDGFADIVISPDQGGGPRVRVLSGKDRSVLADFFGIEDPNFRGGARIAVGDVDGDGLQDLVVAAGFGGGPRIAVFDGRTVLRPASVGLPPKLMPDFFAFENALRNGTFVTVGDVTADGFEDLVFGAGPGGGPRVMVVSGEALLRSTVNAVANPYANFFGGDINSRKGVHVGIVNADNDAQEDVVVGGAAGTAPRVTTYAARTLNVPNPTPLRDEVLFDPNVLSGVFVG